MKNFVLTIIFLFCSLLATDAQTLIGTSHTGGPNGGGSINKFLPVTNEYSVDYSLQSIFHNPWRSTFIQGSDGRLYSMTSDGGSHGVGAIFAYDAETHALSRLVDLDSANGSRPWGSLVQASDGKLYGMTKYGGASDSGVIFSYEPITNTYLKLRDLNRTGGGHPEGSLVQASDGKLYGMTVDGGVVGFGVIFSFDPATSAYTVLRSFIPFDGVNPLGSLIQASDGKLYGMTSATYEPETGGGYGVIFSFDPVTLQYTPLKEFDIIDVITEGGHPMGSLLQASNGLLYGTVSRSGFYNEESGDFSGYGGVFSFNPVTLEYTKVKEFNKADGANPYGDLEEANGKIYGMTRNGGSTDNGVVFSLDLATAAFTKLKDFQGEDGKKPMNSLVLANDGLLYGLTTDGGKIRLENREYEYGGVIFSINPATGVFSKLADLGGNENGANIAGNLVQAGNGLLYGMTSHGGSNGGGVIFSFDAASSTYTNLHNLDSIDGMNPYGSLIQATDGKLYGMTRNGGFYSDAFKPWGFGVIFSVDPATSTYTKLKNFDSTNGAHPNGSLLQASDGKLYGMTTYGGEENSGVIFSFDLVTGTLTSLKNFYLQFTRDGARPFGNLVQATDGKLYGLTSEGGRNWGIVFSFDPANSAFTQLHVFDVTDGRTPYGSLVKGVDDKLYGVTDAGGSSGNGVLFSVDPVTSAFQKLVDFDGTRGRFAPSDRLLAANDGLIYGTRHNEAKTFAGAIFSFDPANIQLSELRQFSDSYAPDGFIEITGCTNPATWYQDNDSDGFGNPGQRLSSCTQPEGYVSDSTDCNDNDNSVHVSSKYFRDDDGDGYGNPLDSLVACSQPDGYVPDSTDCDDTDIDAHVTSKYYRDADDDGFGNPVDTIMSCTIPDGYVTNNGDCDDTDNGAHAIGKYYRDSDGDGFGAPDDSTAACSQPAGYVTNNTDCDDSDPRSQASSTYYRDADYDGFGDSEVWISVCGRAPMGYVKNNFDCDDHSRTRNFWGIQLKMCHNGKTECVSLWEIFWKLRRGWTLGPCVGDCNNTESRNITSVGGKEYAKPFVEEQYSLSSYPNPFKGTSTIRYQIAADSRVSIKVFDVLGRAVTTLVDGYKKAGSYSVSYNAGSLSAGTLYYRIIASSKDRQFEQTKKMILVR